MSTGCIIGLVVGVVGLFGLVIVAILASLAIPAFNRAQARAQGLQVKATMNGLESAINMYQTEYNRFPNLGETDEEKTLEVQGEVLNILMGKHAAGNPRQVVFLDPASFPSRGKGGLVTNAAGQPELKDSFGNVYHMRFDWNGDGSIPDPEHPGSTISETVLIYSAGPDGDYRTWKDNAKNWGP
jgi:type II secretory pathway pseudopilin PulG